jgi:stearoyl-CoA desaturase (delta-9 desaturase)
MQKINPLVFFTLIVYPLIILSLAIYYGCNFNITGMEIALLLSGYYVANISVGIGLHRLWSHATFKTNKIVEFILALFAAGTLQGPALAWASDHFRHHTYTDQENDPHSPKKYKNKFLGFFWSHMGWMLYSPTLKQIDRVTLVKLGRNKILRWQMKYYWYIALIMNLVVPPLVGYLAGGTLQSAFAGYIFIGLGRALQQQMTFCVNSLCHFVGSKKYYSGSARDIWWMFIFLLGENWHNYHHAFANDYRNGVKWYQLDIHKWIIFSMEKLGLAWDLVRISEVRIGSKVKETHDHIINDLRRRLQNIERTAHYLALLAQEQMEKTEKRAEKLAIDAMIKLNNLRNSALVLSNNAKLYLSNPEMIQERIIIKTQKHIKQLEQLAHKLKVHGYLTVKLENFA